MEITRIPVPRFPAQSENPPVFPHYEAGAFHGLAVDGSCAALFTSALCTWNFPARCRIASPQSLTTQPQMRSFLPVAGLESEVPEKLLVCKGLPISRVFRCQRGQESWVFGTIRLGASGRRSDATCLKALVAPAAQAQPESEPDNKTRLPTRAPLLRSQC